MHICDIYLAEFFLEWDMFRTEVVERKTGLLFSNFFSISPESDFLYKVMYKNTVVPDRPESDSVAHAYFMLAILGCRHTHTHTEIM